MIKEKKPYRKPQIHEVRLVIQESVLMACKNMDSGGPGVGGGPGCKGPDSNQCALLAS
jgi:hypothetical protein